MALIEKPEAARRLARAIASDISLYNEDKIIEGIQQDNLFDILEEEIQEGYELYHSRVAPDLLETTNYFERALVDILIRGKGHVQSNIW